MCEKLWTLPKVAHLRLSKAAELAEAAVEETLNYYAFPEQHWRRIRTNNPLERILREIRRRTRVVPGWAIGPQPCCGKTTAHRRNRMVDEEIFEHRAAEGPADERCHHRLSQCRAPLSRI
jgi:Transposase, Mutator family